MEYIINPSIRPQNSQKEKVRSKECCANGVNVQITRNRKHPIIKAARCITPGISVRFYLGKFIASRATILRLYDLFSTELDWFHTDNNPV